MLPKCDITKPHAALNCNSNKVTLEKNFYSVLFAFVPLVPLKFVSSSSHLPTNRLETEYKKKAPQTLGFLHNCTSPGATALRKAPNVVKLTIKSQRTWQPTDGKEVEN